jgi:hypothetical protein
LTEARARVEASDRHGPPHQGGDRDRLTGFLRRIDRRERLAPILRGALAGAALGLAALLARALLESSGLLPSPGGTVLAGLAWLLPVAGAASGYRRPDLGRAAAVGDRRGELLDLLKTAHGIEADDPVQASWRPLLERRAAERVAALDPARLVPMPWRTVAALAAVLLAAVLAGSIRPTTADRLQGGLRGGLQDAGTGEEPVGEEAAGALPAETGTEPEPETLPRLRLSVDQLPRIEPGEGQPLDAGDDGELAEAEGGAQAGAGEAAAAEGAAAANQELLQEVRRQLEEEGTLPPAPAAAEAETGEAGQQAGSGPTAPADPSLEQVSDELTAIEAPTSTPSSQLSKRSAGTAEVAVPAGMEVKAGDAPREGSESGDPGAAEGGASTAPQEGFVDPLGAQATELEVTLELALLESKQQEAARETTREMTPSRAAESGLRASARDPVAPARESAPARRPVPWSHRALVRSYFEPSLPTATPEKKDSP